MIYMEEAMKMKKVVSVLMILCASLQIGSSLIDGLLPNGNFEQGPKPSQMKKTRVIDPHGIPHWELSGYVEYIKSGQMQGDMLLPVPQGDYAVRLGEDASLKTKVINVTKETFYSLSFVFARTCAQEERLNVSVSPNSEPKDWGMLPLQTMYSSDGWDTYSWGFLAEANEIDIVLHNPIAHEKDPACGPLIDFVALKALKTTHRPKGITPPIHHIVNFICASSWGFLAEANEIDIVLHNPIAHEKDPACGPLIDFVALKALKTTHRPKDNMLKNGNFEEGPYIFPNTTWGVLIPPNIEDDHCPLPGWIVESLKAVKYVDADHFTVPEGKRAIELVAGRESAIAQQVITKAGRIYDLTFSVGDANNSCEGSMVVEAFAGNVALQFQYVSKGKGGFKRAKLRFTAMSRRTRVRFLSSYYHMKSDNSGSLCGPVVDDVRLVSVRNPHTP